MSEHSESTQTSLKIPAGLIAHRGYFLLILTPTGTMTAYLPQRGTVVIGRDPASSLRVADPTVSRMHAEIEVKGGGFVLRDLKSTRGTWLRGNRLTSDCALHIGDVVGIGSSTLVLQHSDMVAPSTASAHGHFEQRLQQLCIDAARDQAQFALLMVDISSAPAVGDAGARIRALLRPQDVVAEYAPG